VLPTESSFNVANINSVPQFLNVSINLATPVYIGVTCKTVNIRCPHVIRTLTTNYVEYRSVKL
jgi:hypothetical protein